MVYLHIVTSGAHQFSLLIQSTEMLIILTFHKTSHWFILVVHNDNIMLIGPDELEVAGISDALVRYI